MGRAGDGGGIGAEMRAFLRGFLGQRAMTPRQGAIKRGGERALRFGGEVAGAQGDDHCRAGRGEAFRQPAQRAGFACAGGSEQSGGEGRRRVGPAQQVRKALQQGLGLRRERRLVRPGGGVGLEGAAGDGERSRGRWRRRDGRGGRRRAGPRQGRLGPAGIGSGEALGNALFGKDCGQG